MAKSHQRRENRDLHSWKLRYVSRRNRVFANPRFQYWAAKLPLIRRIAKSRAGQAFDILAGFTYSQTLRACVESGLFDLLREESVLSAREIAARIGLSEAATQTLLRAGRALQLTEEPDQDHWMLGEAGAVLAADKGAQAMIRHHRLLYADLADPLA